MRSRIKSFGAQPPDSGCTQGQWLASGSFLCVDAVEVRRRTSDGERAKAKLQKPWKMGSEKERGNV